MDKPIVLFDGICNLCNGAVQFILKNEKGNELQFASLQSKYGQKVLKEMNLPQNELSTIIFKQGSNHYSESKAVFKISAYLKTPYSLLQYFNFIPSRMSNGVYRWVSRNRYQWFGKKESCWLPSPDLEARFMG